MEPSGVRRGGTDTIMKPSEIDTWPIIYFLDHVGASTSCTGFTASMSAVILESRAPRVHVVGHALRRTYDSTF